ncbi:MAG: uracil-DNA glycosylase [Deltaproteobacteria bacterium]|jgi:DNA polymerase|nr:uracil-DNA glycosylase [Deltaproteobacteria bacterium]
MEQKDLIESLNFYLDSVEQVLPIQPKPVAQALSPAVTQQQFSPSESEAYLLTMDWETLEKACLACQKCRLCTGRKHVVFGVGNKNNPRIAFVGEGPGADEDLQGEPFVGKAGQLLTSAIEKGMKLKRSEVYICNVVKCRPPNNRDPQEDEIQACVPYLYRQLALLNPEIIVTLGKHAQLVLSGVDLGITKLRGQWQSWQGIKLMPTFHPAYILRNLLAKRPFWEDLQAVMRELEVKGNKHV